MRVGAGEDGHGRFPPIYIHNGHYEGVRAY